MTDNRWKFLERPLDAPFVGGAQPEVIKPGIDGFVRESIQNSFDRRVANSHVRVEFELKELDPNINNNSNYMLESSVNYESLSFEVSYTLIDNISSDLKYFQLTSY